LHMNERLIKIGKFPPMKKLVLFAALLGLP
jgi:hypothetical protein